MVIWADIPNEAILSAMEEGRVTPMSPNVPELTAESLAATNGVVAQMGAEPVLKALEQQPDIIVCGRAYDPRALCGGGHLPGP